MYVLFNVCVLHVRLVSRMFCLSCVVEKLVKVTARRGIIKVDDQCTFSMFTLGFYFLMFLRFVSRFFLCIRVYALRSHMSIPDICMMYMY